MNTSNISIITNPPKGLEAANRTAHENVNSTIKIEKENSCSIIDSNVEKDSEASYEHISVLNEKLSKDNIEDLSFEDVSESRVDQSSSIQKVEENSSVSMIYQKSLMNQSASINDQSRLNIGVILEPKQIEFLDQVVKDKRELDKELELGNDYLKKEQYSQALARFEKAFELFKRSFQDDVSLNMRDLFEKLATIYYKKAKYDQSYSIITETWMPYLEKRQEKVTAEVYLHLGKVLRKMGRLKEALEALIQAHKQRSLSLGSYDPKAALILIDIAKVYRSLGHIDLAEKNLLQALKTMKQVRNVGSNVLMVLCQELANIYTEQGNYKLAEEKLTDMLSLYSSEKSLEAANCYFNIANLNLKMKEYMRANHEYKKALSILEDLGNKDKVLLSKVKTGLGDAYKGQEMYQDALKVYKEAFNIKAKLNNKDYSEIANILCSIGELSIKLKQYDAAEMYLEKVKQIYETRLKNEDSVLAKTYHLIGKMYFSKGNSLKALENYMKALEIFSKRSDKNLFEVASLYKGIGEAYANLKEYESAKEYYMKLFEIEVEMEGDTGAQSIKVKQIIDHLDRKIQEHKEI